MLFRFLSHWSWFLPHVELVRFFDLEFSPPRPSAQDLLELKTICIGSKARTIGDTLMLSTLPGRLRAKYPQLSVTTYPRSFNRYVFENNPHVDRVNYLPGRLYGDDCNWGQGQLIQLKEQYFDVQVSKDPKPEIHLSSREQSRAQALRADHRKPICIVHAQGKTRHKVWTAEAWSRCIARWNNRVAFWQVGMQGHDPLPGCDRYFFQAPRWSSCRDLFTVLSAADFFLGIDSGPMHAARAFDLPALILIESGDPRELFERRHRAPYYLYSNFRHAFLYESHEHVNLPDHDEKSVQARIDAFFERVSSDRTH